MRWLRRACVAALLAGCGNLPTTEEGVAYLEVIPPKNLSIEVGASLQLIARALDKEGNVLDVPITWRTPDTAVSVDEEGEVTGLAVGSARVQAAVGSSTTLVSDFIEVKVTAPVEPPETSPR
jgi:uncharacterized protein YjdB